MVGEILNRALAFHQSGRFAQAEHLYKDALSARPKHFGALNLLGVLLAQNEKYEEAAEILRRAVRINPQSESTQYNYGNVLRKLSRPAEALQSFNKALALNPAAPDTWHSRGSTLNDLERFEEALRDFARALELRGQFPDALCNRGKALHGLQRHEEAIATYDEALAMDPRLAEVWISRGEALIHLKRYDDALADYGRAIEIRPAIAAAWLGRGRALLALKRFDEALAAYDQALSRKPDLVEAWLGRANLLFELRRYQEALAACDRVLSLKPDVPGAWLAGANLLFELQRYDEALAAYDKALSLKSDLKLARSTRLLTKLYLCDWSNYEQECASLLSSALSGVEFLEPLVVAAVSGTAEVQLKCTQRWVADTCPPSAQPLCRTRREPGERISGDRIRLGYVSADFRDHAVANLAAGLFEEHDRSRFEVIAISVGSDPAESEMRRRLKSAFDRFIDAENRADDQVAELIHELNIDIAIDLTGFTKHARTKAFARRPAPIQVNYLGYSGTMGAEYYDYIIGDKVVIPPDQRTAYRENVVYLADSYMINDLKRPFPKPALTRAEAGLPEEALAFCAFNNFYKINPQIFDVWMRLLRAIDGSFLWLIELIHSPPPICGGRQKIEVLQRIALSSRGRSRNGRIISRAMGWLIYFWIRFLIMRMQRRATHCGWGFPF